MAERHWQFERVAPLHAARTSQRDVPTTLNTYPQRGRGMGWAEFMDSPLSFLRMHWDHEPLTASSPGFSRSNRFQPPEGGTPYATKVHGVRLSLDRRVHVALVCQVFRKRERDDAAAGRTTRCRSPGGDHHKLAAVDHISAGAGIAAKGQGRLPEDRARVLIKRPKGFVRGSADENQAARRHQRSAIVLRARRRDAARFQFRILDQHPRTL